MKTLEGLTLQLRLDATPEIGAGHGMRIANLAEAWLARGGRAYVVGAVSIEFVQRRFAELGIEAGSDAQPADVVVVDSYDPGVRFRASEGAAAIKILVDDLGGEVPGGYAVVWNPNPYGGAALYPGFGGLLLSGMDHVPLREGLPRWRQERDEVVVTLGGGFASRQSLDALRQLSDLVPEQRFATPHPEIAARWRTIDPRSFWQETARARALVTAAGSTVWEAAHVGIPVIVLQVAGNQRLTYRWTRDAAVPGLNALIVDGDFLAHQLRQLLPAARQLPRVTNGAGRVVAQLAALVRERSAP